MAISNMIENWNNSTNTFLKNHGVDCYYFAKCDDANHFMSGKFLGNHGSGKTVNDHAQCGNTGTTGDGAIIVSEIYDTCSYSTQPIPNQPDLQTVAAHESGHAFDLSVARDNADHGISQSPGFLNLANSRKSPYLGDIKNLTPGTWSSMTTQQKVNYICNIFSINAPSALEQALGSPKVQVCTNSNPTTLNPIFKGQTPTMIANTMLPYFLSNSNPGAAPLYGELWAEEFSIQANAKNTDSNFLAFTDRVISIAPSPIPDFRCTNFVAVQYWLHQIPPNATLLKSQGCNPNPGLLK